MLTDQDLAELSIATGADPGDLVRVAADISSQIGDVRDKAYAIKQILRSISCDSHMGAVEKRDLALRMAKLASRT